MSNIPRYKWERDKDGILHVKETAPWGKQLGLQGVMQSLVQEFPHETCTVYMHYATYEGSPLLSIYQLSKGLYAPVGRAKTNWRDKTGKKVDVETVASLEIIKGLSNYTSEQLKAELARRIRLNINN
jgi:hypothetical protein